MTEARHRGRGRAPRRINLPGRIIVAIAWGIAFGWVLGNLTDTIPYGPLAVAVGLTVWTHVGERRERP